MTTKGEDTNERMYVHTLQTVYPSTTLLCEGIISCIYQNKGHVYKIQELKYRKYIYRS